MNFLFIEMMSKIKKPVDHKLIKKLKNEMSIPKMEIVSHRKSIKRFLFYFTLKLIIKFIKSFFLNQN